MFGELLPRGGGDPIPLLKPVLVIGRRESADIVLRFPNVSGQHCELSIVDGYWHVKDLGSSNGIKVNGVRTVERRIEPGDTLAISRHEFEVCYEPAKLGAKAVPAQPAGRGGTFERSLLEAAGLETRPKERRSPGRPRG